VDALVRELKGSGARRRHRPHAPDRAARRPRSHRLRPIPAAARGRLQPGGAAEEPLFGWSEEDLFALAHDRKGSLWEALRGREEFAESHALLAEFLGKVDFLPPYELYADLLGRQAAG
jgi:ATP-dependent exoDNAse (exonuclease V) beta subunit (contains helicase and exonuclease domains)